MSEKKAILTEGHVGSILFKLTLPMVLGIVSMVAFNLADTFFVAKLGINELAALSYTFPVVLVINSIALGLGLGASAVISRAIGEGDSYKVKQFTTDSLILAFLVVIFFVILGFLTIDLVFRLLGATPELIVLISRYMRIWYSGVIFVVIPMVGNNAIRATGDMKTSSIIMLIAVCSNLILDPILIFGFGPFPEMGLEGAAVATVIARAIALLVSLYVLLFQKRMITFKFSSIDELLKSWKNILYIALPAAGARVIVPLTTGVITWMLSAYGPEVVAAYGVSSRIEFFAMTLVFALSTVIAPFVGQNLGAKKKDRVILGIKYSKEFSFIWGLIVFVFFIVFSNKIAFLFSDNQKVVTIVAIYLRIVSLGYGIQGIFLLSNSVLNVLHKPLHAITLSVFQMFVLYVPLALLGSHLLKVTGVFIALTVAYLIGGIVANFILKKELSY